jgi:hypothetical protein
MTEKAYRFSASAIDELNKTSGRPTPVEKTVCFVDGRPGCPTASAVRPDRLVSDPFAFHVRGANARGHGGNYDQMRED